MLKVMLAFLFVLNNFLFASNSSEVQGIIKKQNISQNSYYARRLSLFEILNDKKADIMFLGDSITEGMETAEMFGCQAINRGVSGDTTVKIYYRRKLTPPPQSFIKARFL